MKPHYFDQDAPDNDDYMLTMAIAQGYTRPHCLLGGAIVLGEINRGNNPCHGCEGPRDKCHGHKKV